MTIDLEKNKNETNDAFFIYYSSFNHLKLVFAFDHLQN